MKEDIKNIINDLTNNAFNKEQWNSYLEKLIDEVITISSDEKDQVEYENIYNLIMLAFSLEKTGELYKSCQAKLDMVGIDNLTKLLEELLDKKLMFKISIPTFEQAFGDKDALIDNMQLDVFKNYSGTNPTDFAKSLTGSTDRQLLIQRKNSESYTICKYGVPSVITKEEEKECLIRPIILSSPATEMIIYLNKNKDLIKMGSFFQEKITGKEEELLRNETLRNETLYGEEENDNFNQIWSDAFSDVYSLLYKGQKIAVAPFRIPQNRYSYDLSRLIGSNRNFFKKNEVEWIVEKNGTLIANQELLAGLNIDDKEDTPFVHSKLCRFLNIEFAAELKLKEALHDMIEAAIFKTITAEIDDNASALERIKYFKIAERIYLEYSKYVSNIRNVQSLEDMLESVREDAKKEPNVKIKKM